MNPLDQALADLATARETLAQSDHSQKTAQMAATTADLQLVAANLALASSQQGFITAAEEVKAALIAAENAINQPASGTEVVLSPPVVINK